MSVRVLVAEDSVLTRRALVTVLSLNDYDVVGEACDGVEAVEMYKELEPDIVLMDLAMPKKHGIDAIREISGSYLEAKIVVLTALYSPEKRQAALDAGAVSLVGKPFEVPVLLEAIKEALS